MPNLKVFDLVPLTSENIEAGLVLRSPARDGSVHIFNDTIIESFEDDNKIVCLARPYSYLKNGVVHTDIERTKIPVDFLTRGTHYYVMEGTRPARVWPQG